MGCRWLSCRRWLRLGPLKDTAHERPRHEESLPSPRLVSPASFLLPETHDRLSDHSFLHLFFFSLSSSETSTVPTWRVQGGGRKTLPEVKRFRPLWTGTRSAILRRWMKASHARRPARYERVSPPPPFTTTIDDSCLPPVAPTATVPWLRARDMPAALLHAWGEISPGKRQASGAQHTTRTHTHLHPLSRLESRLL